MEKKVPVRVLDAIAAEPWAITDAGLRQIISIASREVDVEAVEAKLGRPLDNTRAVTVRDGVAVIPVTGPIFRHANMFTRISGATSIEDLATDFTTANEDASVRAIVLNMDTPGGTAHGPAELGRLIVGRKGTKPVIAYGGGAYVASGGLWIAAAADERVSSETVLWGSLGSITRATGPAKPKEGSAPEYEFVYSRSPKKRVDLETDEGKAQVQAWVDDLGDVFVANVAEFMGITTEKVLADFGQGDLMIASKAKEAGMIDRISTLEDLISELASKTRSGSYITPRMAARTNHPTSSAKENNMSNGTQSQQPTAQQPDLEAQLAALRQRNSELEASLTSGTQLLQTEARTRIGAEVEAFKASLRSKSDLRHNVQTIDAFAELLLVAKCAAAGLPSVTIGAAESKRDLALDVKALGEFVATRVDALSKLGAKFDPPTTPLPEGEAAPAANAAVTLADFSHAATDVKAASRISAAVKARRKTNDKFTREDLYRELATAAGK